MKSIIYAFLIGGIVTLIASFLGIKEFSLEWWIFILGLDFVGMKVILDLIKSYKNRWKNY
jgi:hypothetical protein